jgi:hypothetical protein
MLFVLSVGILLFAQSKKRTCTRDLAKIMLNTSGELDCGGRNFQQLTVDLLLSSVD